MLAITSEFLYNITIHIANREITLSNENKNNCNLKLQFILVTSKTQNNLLLSGSGQK